ncbi:Cell division protein FtsI/penicillin-binding protein 2 [Amphibacillus marinus]|uniref:serine-type D-Ala-D-Ala carboxypeptidase n=1 Tax=Amphibacillus marinus TaxID=872970 RepID=A0A1H8HGT0_9BACI|nr:penicillin-binding protein 2 [Amphibacillus marinus]SEN55117.1 Cell division protein FtsI/penicillin-binding protein 2 [Amphibacillus marinus]
MAKKKKKRAQLPLRLNFLFVFVFLMFSLLILQLGVVQILNGEEARQRIEETESTRSAISVPRGLMYDRFGNLILDNEPERAITYTPPKNGESAAKRLELAEKLAKIMVMSDDFDELEAMVSDRDKKEYWYIGKSDTYEEEQHHKEAESRLTTEESELTAAEQYRIVLDRIEEDDYNIYDWSDPNLLNIVAIKKELDQAFGLSPHTIKNEGVTDEEYALISENLSQLPGIDATIDWNRVRLYGSTFASFLGNISSSKEGIPGDNQDYYLTLGYSRNDRVGTSGLEQQYESVLRGQKEIIQYTTDNDGNVVGNETVVDGKSGNDLILTVDMELNEILDEIVLEELEAYINQDRNQNRYMTDALVAVLDPKTGDVLAMSAAHYDQEKQEYSDQAYRVIYDAHIPGSAIKGATVLTGYQTGVISPNTVITDRPINIAGTPRKASYTTMGTINDLDAITRSSNVYMFEIALRISGATYRPNEPLRGFNSDGFQIMRKHFNQFGLGVETGIDLPYESTGVVGSNIRDGGLLLDFAIGQYDTYTTLQLAQYVSTIANDGYRISPRLVKEVRQANGNKETLGSVLESNSPNILNRIDMDESYIERVQSGFRRVATHSQGTGRSHWADSPYDVAVKTGTAQNQFWDNGVQRETNNLTLVGYAPYDEPEVAFAIVVPRTGVGNNFNGIHHNIGNRLMDAYFDLKEERDQAGFDETNIDEMVEVESE